MKILALDSSGLVASVAVLEDDVMVAEYTMNYKKTHSQTLVPMLEQMSKMIELDLHSVDAIAIAAGPGSFTGLRIGSATAKGLGLALNKPIVPVPTVDALAYNLYGTSQVVCPIMDARRNQVYTGIYEFVRATETEKSDHMSQYNMTTIMTQSALMIDELVVKLNQLNREVIFIGDGIPVFAEQLMEMMQVSYSFAPAHMSRQRAGAVGALGMQYYKNGIFQSADEHEPEYLRLSQAERERAEHADS